jgi:hypothetical protein
MTWAAIRKRIANSYLSTSIYVFDHDNIDIFSVWAENTDMSRINDQSFDASNTH